MNKKLLHESGLNVIQNPDGSFAFEWDPTDERWNWLNDLTDDQVKIIMEQAIKEYLDDFWSEALAAYGAEIAHRMKRSGEVQ